MSLLVFFNLGTPSGIFIMILTISYDAAGEKCYVKVPDLHNMS